MLEKLAERLAWQIVPGLSVQIFNEFQQELMEKGAESAVLRELATLGQLRPGKMLGMVPNAPGPLASMLVGGMAGAGLGYGAGYLAEKLFPNSWDKRKVRRNLMLAGGLLGAAPGATFGVYNVLNKLPFNSTKHMNAGYTYPKRPVPQPRRLDVSQWTDKLQQIMPEIKESYDKAALLDGTGLFGGPMIDVNELNQVIWKDPRVARPLSPVQQAAMTGLVSGAANLPGKTDTRFVTPMDIGRVTAGMGTGYLSGSLVGKALGIMLGMPAQTQDKMKQTGMWAGAIANMLPIAFGG